MTTDLEELLATALARRAVQATPGPDLDAVVRDAARPPAAIDPGLLAGAPRLEPPRSTAGAKDPAPDTVPLVGSARRRPRVVAVMAAAAAIVGAVTVGLAVTRGDSEHDPSWGQPEISSPTTPALTWAMPHAVLSAESITIEYVGQTFAPTPGAIAESRLLGRSEELIRLTWSEHGIELTWEVSLKLRDDEWWVEQMTVMGGAPVTEGPPTTGMPVLQLDDDSERADLGEALTGAIDLAVTEGGASARVRVTGLSLLGFRDRGPDGDAVPVEPEPLESLAPAPPLPDDVAPTGMYVPVRDWMAFSLAQDTLVSECMAAAGFHLPVMPDDSVVQLYGQFESSAGLSVQGRRAAAATGYHSVDAAEAFSWFDEAVEQVPEHRRDDFHDTRTGCESASSAALGWAGDSGPMRAWGIVGDIREQAYGDPNVLAALNAWGRCVYDIVGERAANPNELARMYAFANGDPSQGEATEHEKAVAVADFDCQQQVDWVTVWHTAVVERERAAMGERVGEYDQWVRDYQAMIARAQQVVDERGIVLPTLD